MDERRARLVLEVQGGASPDEIRSSYRRLMRLHHPDASGADTTRRAAELNQAYAVLLAARSLARPQGAAAGASERAAPLPGDEALLVVPAGADLFERLCEAADDIGHLSYVDRSNAILETIVRVGGPACSLMICLERHGDDVVAACTLESLDGRPGPPIADVVGRLAAALS